MRPLLTRRTHTVPPEHNFMQTRQDWEFAVFDNAAYFMTLDWSLSPNDTSRRREWPTFEEAIAWAQDKPRLVVYAITRSERAIVLDRKLWPFWQARQETAK